jgi:dephospho-CoA kinase
MAARVRRVALTGGIATGKSHVRARFEQHGVASIDADVLAREAVAPTSAGLDAVFRRFGESVRDTSGGLDRKRLGAIVFADAQARRDLEKIIHPFVKDAMNRWFASLDPARHAFAVADIPLLFEGGREADFDAVIVAACEPSTQLRRLMLRDGLSEGEARQRIDAQWPLAEKVAKADFVIRTDGTIEDTNRRVDELRDLLAKDRRGGPEGPHLLPTTNH